MPAPDLRDLLSLTGHELRGHAGVLGGYLKLLARERAHLPERQQQAVDAADRALARLIETLDEMRDLQRWLAPDRPQPPVTPSVDLGDVLREVAAVRREGVAAHVDDALPSLPWTGDRVALTRALIACRDAVARGHLPPVTLRLAARRDGERAVIEVLAEPEAPRARRPFDARRSGLGLRLVLAHAVIEAHGGRLADLAEASADDDTSLPAPGPAAGIEITLPLAAAR